MMDGPNNTGGDSHRLPIIGTIVLGYREVGKRIGFYCAMALTWAVAFLGVGLLLGWIANLSKSMDYDGALIAVHAEPFAVMVVSLLGTAVVLVAACRAILLKESPSWPSIFRIGRRQLRLLSFTLVFYAVIYVEILVLWNLLQLTSAPTTLTSVFTSRNPSLGSFFYWVLWGLLQSLTLSPFFGLAFPLAAIDAGTSLFRRSAQLSRGYRWRIAVLSMLSHLPFYFLSFIPYLAWHAFGGVIAVIAGAATCFVSLVGTAVSAAAFSVALDRVAGHLRRQTYEVFD